jgi:hypothetical protein
MCCGALVALGRDLVQFFLTGRQPLCNHGGIASELEQFALGVLLCKLCTGFFARPLLAAPRGKETMSLQQ